MDDSFRVLQKIVHAANMRQKVLASNVANADTPGYRAKDIQFDNLLKKEMKLTGTDRKHRTGPAGGGVSGTIVQGKGDSWKDGNNVELNAEVARMTENALTHDAAIRILNSKIKMYKSAIKGR